MTAEIFGRETGLGRGRGGHMHLFDPATHFSCSGIIAEGYPPALGQAFAFQRRGSDRVAVAVTGEGAANQGAFHESLNLAALWKLPVVFVVEDNDWAISVPRVGVHGHAVQRRPGRGLRHARRADRGQRRRGRVRGGRRRGRPGPRGRRPDPDRGAHPAAVGPLRGRRAGLPPRPGRRAGPRPDPALRAAAARGRACSTTRRSGASRTRRRRRVEEAIDVRQEQPGARPRDGARRTCSPEGADR